MDGEANAIGGREGLRVHRFAAAWVGTLERVRAVMVLRRNAGVGSEPSGFCLGSLLRPRTEAGRPHWHPPLLPAFLILSRRLGFNSDTETMDEASGEALLARSTTSGESTIGGPSAKAKHVPLALESARCLSD